MKSNIQLPDGQEPLGDKSAMRKAFGQRLYRMLQAKNWNQSDLARASGLGRDAISTYINGRSFPEPVSMQKIADAFGVDVGALYPTSGHAIPLRGAPVEAELSASDPNKMRIRLDRDVTFETGARIIDLLKAENDSGG